MRFQAAVLSAVVLVGAAVPARANFLEDILSRPVRGPVYAAPSQADFGYRTGGYGGYPANAYANGGYGAAYPSSGYQGSYQGPAYAYGDPGDRAAARRAQRVALLSVYGTAANWRNPRTGSYGTAVAVGVPVADQSGRLCRTIQETVVIGGQARNDQGLLCATEARFRQAGWR